MTRPSLAIEAPPLPVPRRRITYEELVAEMPETNQPCELWDGEIVMSPASSFYHQEVVLRFYERLVDWVQRQRLGKVVAAPYRHGSFVTSDCSARCRVYFERTAQHHSTSHYGPS